jgi:hypothetical protein
VHLVAAAVDAGADAICTANTATDFTMSHIGSIEIYTPTRLAAELGI